MNERAASVVDRDQATKQALFDAAIAEGLASESCGVTLDEILVEARRRHGRHWVGSEPKQ
ncbi:MAG: hypothetical protein ACOYO0_03125 [Sandarakinorhabdus sp.]